MIEDLLSDLFEGAVDLAQDAAENLYDVAKEGVNYVAENGGDEVVDLIKTTASTTTQALFDHFKK